MEEEFLGALYKGGELLASGKIVEAREHLEKAHGLAPKNEKAQNLLGLAYFKLGLFEQASQVYEKLVNENPTDATLRVNLGLVYLKTNNLERCIKEFETATDLEPTHKKAHNYLGLALAQQGAYVKAKEHFELAGSDQMAEKMARAISAQSAPSGIHNAVAPRAPVNVVIGEESSAPPPPAPKKAASEEDPIEVMSDEEAPSDAYTVPDEAPPARASAPGLGSDWGAQLKQPAAATTNDEMRFAEDEGPPEETLTGTPVEELPVVEAEVEVVPELTTPTKETPAWLTMEAAEAARVNTANESAATWVTETVSDVPLPSEAPNASETTPASDDSSWSAGAETTPAAAADDASWAAAVPPSASSEEASWSATAETTPAASDAAWATGPETSAPSDQNGAGSWATGAQTTSAAADDASSTGEGESSWATGAEARPAEVGDASWARGAASAPAPAADDSSWATGAESAPAPAADDSSWAATGAESAPAPAADDSSWATGAESAPAPAADDSSWATGAEAAPAPAADDSSWATGAESAPAPAADDSSWATGAESAPAPAADDSSWATGAEAAPAAAADDSSWATGAAPAPAAEDSSWATGAAPAPDADQASWDSGAAPESDASSWATSTAGASAIPPPEPSAPISITVEEPRPSAPAAPAGYTPMQPQRLVDLGASGAWVHEPSAGPFHLSSDGLAVTVNGEMLVRMVGLVAIVGSIDVKPENKRRRGRSSADPFGTGPSQLQRVKGNGMLYLEPGRSKFHAVDLADQNGVNIDDDGAYLREELVFAFEEAISFDNGKLTSEGQTLELAHLKGNGRVLLQLDGTLRAMPIPLGAPMVVPLQRLVGWFGRVTPRLMGFGGRGAIELTGEGYALLGTPAEGR